MKKTNAFFYLLLLCLPLPFLQAQQIVFKEGFENTLPGCEDNLEFLEGCVPGWINTHGTANIWENSGGYLPGPSYEGGHHAHIYITKNNNCLPDYSADYGEGMALNFDFEIGETYKISYAIRGKVTDLTWVLTNGLTNLGGTPLPACIAPNNAIPPTPTGSQVLTPSVTDFELLMEYQVFETDWFTASADFGQLWFRGSNLNSPLNVLTSHIMLDDIVIQKKADCKTACPLPITDLNACVEEGNYGSIVFECVADYEWELPAGSTAIEMTSSTHSAILNASPGVYTVTVTDCQCIDVLTYEVLEACCTQDTICSPPMTTYCDYSQAGVEIIWDAVSGVTDYLLEIKYNDNDCGCGSGGGTIDQTEVVTGTSYLVDGFFIPCFSWTVSSLCGDDVESEPSERMCFDGSQDCFPSDKVVRRSDASSTVTAISAASVYPNPISKEFNFKVELTKASSLTIDVFDVNGKRLLNLMEDNVRPGVYHRTWTPRQTLPDGVYFVRFQTDSQYFSETVIISNNQ